MTIILVLKAVGWIFAVTPVLIFLGISFSMIRGAMKDDELIGSLVTMAMGAFFMGVIMLVLLYLTDRF